jgi:hypothetical protein
MVSVCSAPCDCRPGLPHTARLDMPPSTSSDASMSSSSIMSVMQLVPWYRCAWNPRAAGAKVAVMWGDRRMEFSGSECGEIINDVITQDVNLRQQPRLVLETRYKN